MSEDVTDRRNGEPEHRPGRWRRVAWFVGLYAAGLVTMAAVTYSLRLLIV